MSKPDPARHAPQEVEAYLAALPEDQRALLASVRSVIRELAPDCTERVSYGVPIFRLKRDLVGLSAAKNHCALHVMSPALVNALADTLHGVTAAGATLRFTPDAPLPRDVLERVIYERMRESDLG